MSDYLFEPFIEIIVRLLWRGITLLIWVGHRSIESKVEPSHLAFELHVLLLETLNLLEVAVTFTKSTFAAAFDALW